MKTADITQLTAPFPYCGPYPTAPVCFCSGYSSQFISSLAWPGAEELFSFEDGCVVSGARSVDMLDSEGIMMLDI
jgi:hypothetical protein